MRTIFKITLVLFVLVHPLFATGQADDLAKNFQNPPAEYSMLPFWSWNGTLKTDKLIWQLDQMLDKGIYGAFLHVRAGLDESKTPYFSDGFWKAMDTTIHYSAKKGFYTYLYDEDKWPSGSAGGRTIAANPEEFTKKVLFYQKMEVVGPQTINLNLQKHPLAVFAGQLGSNGNYVSASQVNLTDQTTWKVPSGRWAISSFEMQKDPGEQIDYLDSAAVAKFIEITHEEYFKRYGPFFGNTIPGIFFDEIYANYSRMTENIFWTDDFQAKFRKIKGYDLTDKLPLILFSDPGKSEKLRCDYFEVVKDMYVKAWFKQYADWCAAHKIWATGHTTEKLLHYKRQSDYFSTMGQLQVPGTDNEEYRYGFPRMIDWYNTKQISSIGHLYDRKRVMAESMGGGGYVIPLEEYKYGFSMLGVYGVNLFIPHLFHYTVDSPETQADWPPSWFYTNPYWKYFKPLADFASRISYMNSQGRAICEVAVLFPLTDLWEGGYPDKIDDSYYKAVQQELLDNHIGYDIIDPASLAASKIEEQKICAGNGKYSVLVLPAIHAIRTDLLRQIANFVEKGGTVIALKDLPVLSENGPSDDEKVSTTVKALFGFPPSALKPDEYYQWNLSQTERYTSVKSKNGGVACYTRFLGQLPGIINSRISPDFKVIGDNGGKLQFNHRQVGDTEVYQLVNDCNAPQKYHISLINKGIPEIWNPETGTMSLVGNYQATAVVRAEVNRTMVQGAAAGNAAMGSAGVFGALAGGGADIGSAGMVRPAEAEYQTKRDGSVKNGKGVKEDIGAEKGRIELMLDFNPRESYFLALRPRKQSQGDGLVDNTNLNDKQAIKSILLDGKWQFQLVPHALDYAWKSVVESDTLALPIMKFQPERKAGEGAKKNWKDAGYRDTEWKTVKIKDVYNQIHGIQRYLSGWDASWISYYDYSVNLPDISGGERNFRKEFNLEAPIREAKIAITADQTYELRVNDQLVGKDQDWKVAEVYDISAGLRKGENVIEVKTTNTKGLLAQVVIKLKNGKSLTLGSDESWQVSTGKLDGQPAFRFADPPMGSWGRIDNPLQKMDFPLKVWYRQQLPPGTQVLKKPNIKGNYTVYVNGNPVSFDKGIVDISGVANKKPSILTISVNATDESCGMQNPVEVVCGKSEQALVPWSEMGLGWYSGRGIYTKKVTIPTGSFQKGTRLILNPGQVNYFAEIWVNEKLVTFHPWAPFRTDITDFLKEGENTVSIVVANLLANQATWNILDANIPDKASRWWHQGSIMREKEKLVSGLLGPVSIEIY
ncbi:MAG: glycosyl hydrolase [Prolixibacteraceae bacterium]